MVERILDYWGVTCREFRRKDQAEKGLSQSLVAAGEDEESANGINICYLNFGIAIPIIFSFFNNSMFHLASFLVFLLIK